jgi:hypothetical protein
MPRTKQDREVQLAAARKLIRNEARKLWHKSGDNSFFGYVKCVTSVVLGPKLTAEIEDGKRKGK